MALLIPTLLLIPILLYAIYDIRLDLTKGRSKGSIIASFILWSLIAISAFFSYFTYKVHVLYGIFQYLTPLTFTIFGALSEKYDLSKKIGDAIRDTIFHKELAALMILTLSAPFVMLIVAIPVAVIPYLSIAPKVEELPIEQIDPAPIIVNLNRINDSIEELENQLIVESRNIDVLSEAVVSELEKRNDELEHISNERAKVVAELNYYKSLASLTKNQVQAVVSALQRSRYLDYFVGFLIGLVTGGLFFIVQNHAFRKYFRNIKSDKETL